MYQGRYAFDFANREDAHQPSCAKQRPARTRQLGPGRTSRPASPRDSRLQRRLSHRVIGSKRTTTKKRISSEFRPHRPRTNNIDHHRTADYRLCRRAQRQARSSLRDFAGSTAVLLLATIHRAASWIAWQIRTSVRLHGAHLYVANHRPSSSASGHRLPRNS